MEMKWVLVFKSWLERDPKQSVDGDSTDWRIGLFWERNFYPDISMIINDLYSKGLLDAGTYEIDINW
jgi:hypothetical protein